MFQHRHARYLIAALMALAVGLCACGRKTTRPEREQPQAPTATRPPTKDEVSVTYLGQDAFLIGDAVRIMIAPHDDRVGYGMGEVEADLVLIGNSDADREQAKVVKGSPRIIDQPGEHTAKGTKIRAIAPAGAGMKEPIYCFELKSVKFCHLRLRGTEITDELAKTIGPVDVVMLPVGNPPSTGGYSLDAKEAWAAVGTLNPRMILPMRYKNDKTKADLRLETIDRFDEIASQAEANGQKEAFVLRGGHTMRISTSNLPQGPMRIVYVLKPW